MSSSAFSFSSLLSSSSTNLTGEAASSAACLSFSLSVLFLVASSSEGHIMPTPTLPTWSWSPRQTHGMSSIHFLPPIHHPHPAAKQESHRTWAEQETACLFLFSLLLPFSLARMGCRLVSSVKQRIVERCAKERYSRVRWYWRSLTARMVRGGA